MINNITLTNPWDTIINDGIKNKIFMFIHFADCKNNNPKYITNNEINVGTNNNVNSKDFISFFSTWYFNVLRHDFTKQGMTGHTICIAIAISSTFIEYSKITLSSFWVRKYRGLRDLGISAFQEKYNTYLSKSIFFSFFYFL